MKCDEVRELLPLYCGGDLDQAETMPVIDHLGCCSECRAELERTECTLRMAVTAFNRLEAPAPGSGFWKEIEQRISTESSSGVKAQQPEARETVIPEPAPCGAADSGPARGFWRLVTPFAAAAVLIALIGVSIERSKTGTPTGHTALESDARKLPPIVEPANDPNVTVMTFQTDDPHITIAWFFEENTKTERR